MNPPYKIATNNVNEKAFHVNTQKKDAKSSLMYIFLLPRIFLYSSLASLRNAQLIHSERK
ncbi:hypothetical protein CW304_14810 [Bacillus sp. UFRGS-B20]|nr:hypothetical protein CW304_14810 [Bacillus sp. UFRGS-B20]